MAVPEGMIRHCSVEAVTNEPWRIRLSNRSFQTNAYSASGRFDAGTVNWLRRDDDVRAGFWACTPEQQPDVNEAEFSCDETIYLLDGDLEVEVVGGTNHRLTSGDSASFVKGTVGRWKVLSPVREFFVYP